MTDQTGNISTEHQRPGDAKRPSDTLDRPPTGAEADNLGKNTQEDDAGTGATADNMGANQVESDHDAAATKDAPANNGMANAGKG